MKLFFIGRREVLTPFNNYRLVALKPAIRALIVVAVLFNALLLIPDMINLGGAAETAVVALRTVFSLMTLSLLWWLEKMKTFNVYAIVLTIMEAAALLVFLVVFSLYPEPDAMIQLMGMIVLVMFIYLTPNRWVHMNSVAAAGIISFLLCEVFIVKGLEDGQVAAGAVYLVVVAVLCAIFSLHIRSYQYREYVSRSDLLRDYATDPLTRVGNRVRLEEEASKWMDWSLQYSLPLSLIVVDVDNMKQVNDTHGHLRGDEILCQIAHEMSASLRKNDVCVRWGGDEFMVLLPNTHLSEAESLAERIQSAICSRVFEPLVSVTCSFGVAQLQPGQSLQALIAQADGSMYMAKRMGKNAIHIAAQEPNVSI